nr:cytochrome c-type biogenesis protein [Rhodovulum sp. PH10]
MTTAVLALAAVSPALAVQPDEMLKDPALEQRARDISQHLRCLVCQNQSIDDSDAGLAKDLRLLVRERLEKGDTNSEVVDFLVSRYGEFVLLKPRFEWHTALLWIAPGLVLLAGAIGFGVMLHRRRDLSSGGAPRPLTEAEKKKLAALTDGGGRPAA